MFNLTLLASSGFPAWSVIFFIVGAAFLLFSLIYGAFTAYRPGPNPPGYWSRTDLGLALIIVAIGMRVIFNV